MSRVEDMKSLVFIHPKYMQNIPDITTNEKKQEGKKRVPSIFYFLFLSTMASAIMAFMPTTRNHDKVPNL